jgi:anti-anti-sigma regulatory factor
VGIARTRHRGRIDRASLAQRAVAGIVPGDHVCASFGSDDEHGAIVAAYARAALLRNARFLYLADRSDDATIRAHLAGAGIDLDAGRAHGQIKIRRFARAPARIDPKTLIATLQADRIAARRDGYDALCGAAEMSWTMMRPADTDAVVEYEREVSRAFTTADVAGLCQYDRRLFEPDVLERLVAVHDFRVTTGADATTTARGHMTIRERADGVLSLAGELDIDSSAYLAARLGELDADDGDLVVLTRDLEFVAASGCRALVRAAEELTPGRRLLLPDPSAQLVRVLTLCGWSSHERLVLT